jgi:hypothetical protein
VIQVARTGPAQYAFPWALLYDIPMPDKAALRYCDVIKEVWSVAGERTREPGESCPHAAEPWHQADVLCPYGFWGLKHWIEQPIARLRRARDGTGHTLPASAETTIPIGPGVDLAVGITRDTALDAARLAAHTQALRAFAAFAPPAEADDWAKVRTMLQAPSLVYLLCHGEYNDARKEPYLGVGPRDGDITHQVYPNELLSWARTQPPTLWETRRPLIFINGCHTANLTPGQVLNFVSTFGDIGASGVIGTEVSVRLPVAAEAAETLLRRLADEARVAEAIHELRWRLANKGNLIGLAYTPYCLADLHMARAAPPG